jgi:hypothetical protein
MLSRVGDACSLSRSDVADNAVHVLPYAEAVESSSPILTLVSPVAATMIVTDDNRHPQSSPLVLAVVPLISTTAISLSRRQPTCKFDGNRH